MKGLLAILPVAAFAFAGCAGKGATTSSSTGPGSASALPAPAATTATSTTTTSAPASTSTPTSTGTSTGPGQPNRAPAIGTLGATRANATSLRFAFAFTASDPDGDPLTWRLDADTDGTVDASGAGTSGNATFTYAAGGRHNATLTVSDGTLVATRTLAVDAALATGPRFTFVGNTTAPTNPSMSTALPGVGALGAGGCAAFQSAGTAAEASGNGKDCAFAALPAGLAGRPFTAASSQGNAEVDLWDSCSPDGARVDNGFFNGEADEAGTIPAGAGCVVVWDGALGETGAITFTVA